MIRYRIRVLLGWLFNLAGFPGFIRECDYEAGITNATIKVRVGALFTIIDVNGLEIYFHRLTGKIDGVGGAPADLSPQEAEGIAEGLRDVAAGRVRSLEDITADLERKDGKSDAH
jgi:hypothetical protein